MPWNVITNIANDYGLPLILVLAFFIVLKLYQRYITNQEKTRTLKHDEVKLLSEILNYQGSDKKFLIEQLIEAKYKYPFSWREISFLMKQASPSEALSYYTTGINILEFPYTSNEPVFRGNHKKEWYRKLSKYWFIFLYFFFCLFGLFLLYLSPFAFESKGFEYGCVTLALIPIFGLFALFSLKEYVEVKFGEKLIELVEYSKTVSPPQSKSHLLL
jgi:hypothetical protein